MITWLLELFEKADSLNSGALDENEVVNLMRKINATVTTPVIYQKLKVSKVVHHFLTYNESKFKEILTFQNFPEKIQKQILYPEVQNLCQIL